MIAQLKKLNDRFHRLPALENGINLTSAFHNLGLTYVFDAQGSADIERHNDEKVRLEAAEVLDQLVEAQAAIKQAIPVLRQLKKQGRKVLPRPRKKKVA